MPLSLTLTLTLTLTHQACRRDGYPCTAGCRWKRRGDTLLAATSTWWVGGRLRDRVRGRGRGRDRVRLRVRVGG